MAITPQHARDFQNNTARRRDNLEKKIDRELLTHSSYRLHSNTLLEDLAWVKEKYGPLGWVVDGYLITMPNGPW